MESEIISLPSKTGKPAADAGDLLVVRTGGGGGYGEPSERPASLRDRDETLGLAASD